MRPFMMVQCTCAAALLILASSAGAADESFIGVVSGDDVNVRSGAGLNYYVVLQLDQGELVTVHKRLYDWYAISAPAGSFSYVESDDIQLDQNEGAADGYNATVTGTRATVKAPAPIGPEKSYRSQAVLTEGDRVHVTGTERSYYRIKPPDGARLYLHSDFVTRATEADLDAAALRQADQTPATEPDVTDTMPPQVSGPIVLLTEDEPEEDATGTATTTVIVHDGTEMITPETIVAEIASEQATTEVILVPAMPSDADLVAVESRFDAASDLPVEQQPLDSLIVAYEALQATALDETDAAIVDARLKVLASRQEVRASMVQIAEARRELQQQQTLASELPPVLPPPKSYTAVGRLFASTLYTGDALPRLYRLVEPLSGLTIAYVEPSDVIDLRPMLGRLVGVVGEARYDPSLKLKVVAVDEADILGAQPAVTAARRHDAESLD